MLAASFTACNYGLLAEQPDYYEVMELYGTPYERGLQHGQKYANKIRSLFTMLLTSSIYPYLNREHLDVASVMLRYQEQEYMDGRFCSKMMTESAWALAEYIPDEYLQEMQGIADGAEMPFEEILILNTFFDTLMGFRSITFFIKLVQGPWLLTTEFLGGLNTDGQDNDGDGDIDEPDEGLADPYEPLWYASMVEVPTDTRIRFILDDDKEGVNPESIRIQLNETIYTADHPSIQTAPYARDGKTIEVIFTPPDGLPAASVVSIVLQCTDLLEIVRVPPHHPRSMRDERITFTTVGYGQKTWEVANRGYDDGRTQPPSLGFAVRGSATKTGDPMLGHNFAMLDSDTTHKHATLFMHHPDQGKAFAVVGYTGIVWGFSGMNEDGFTFLYNSSDTLNNSFTKGFNEGLIFARLLPSGLPVGMMGRELLAKSTTVNDGVTYLEETLPTFGWNFLLADAQGGITAVELDANILGRDEGWAFSYTPDTEDPENVDQWGQPYGSVGPDDLFMASHYQKNINEIDYEIAIFPVSPQRFWSSFYFRSVRAFYNLALQIKKHYGELDLGDMIAILSRNDLEDQRDSMNSVVYEPAKLKMHVAAGQVPPSDGDYEEFDLGQAIAEGGNQ